MKREEEKMDKKSLENLLKSRVLENMSDEEKVAINHASFELLQEQHERVSSLIERVADSLNGEVIDYTIGTVLLDREEVRLYEKEISPMFLSDLNKKVSKQKVEKQQLRNWRRIKPHQEKQYWKQGKR